SWPCTTGCRPACPPPTTRPAGVPRWGNWPRWWRKSSAADLDLLKVLPGPLGVPDLHELADGILLAREYVVDHRLAHQRLEAPERGRIAGPETAGKLPGRGGKLRLAGDRVDQTQGERLLRGMELPAVEDLLGAP